MSINTALLAGTAGLRANSSALALISDNISNSNTVGFKRARNDFESLMRDQAGFSTYNSSGVSAISTVMVSEQGAIQASQLNTHLAVSGEGFFVTRQKTEFATPSDPYFYTRAGHFAPDSEGFLRNTSGFYLYGWPLDDGATTDVSFAPSDLEALEPIRVTGIGGAAEATSSIALSANLDSAQVVAANAGTYDITATPGASMASGDFTPDFQTTIQIYDTLGGIHTLALSFLKSTTPNEWNVEAHVVPSSDLQATGRPNGTIATGVISFSATGQIDSANTTFPDQLVIEASGTTATAANAGWATAAGLDRQIIDLDIGVGGTVVSPGGFTQYDSPSSVQTSTVNGLAFGALSTVEVDREGFVNAIFANGLSRSIYQVPMATFSNPSGLRVVTGGAYLAGPDSGTVSMKAAGQAGAGFLQPKSLEASTVDLAEEFSNLIVTQRAYSASSKIITTADEMLDELIRIKR